MKSPDLAAPYMLVASPLMNDPKFARTVMVIGHHDKTGGGARPESWNSAHMSRGCGQADLQGTGGDGLFYCFAAD